MLQVVCHDCCDRHHAVLCEVFSCTSLFCYINLTGDIVQLNAIRPCICTDKYNAGKIIGSPFLFTSNESSFLYNFWLNKAHTCG